MINDFLVLKKLLSPEKIYNLYFFKPVKGFSIDTRTIKKGRAYIALKGEHKDGHDYIAEAVKKGASLIIAEKYAALPRKVPFFIVSDSYLALARCAQYARKYRNPFVYAITGSVGKTTTKEMLAFCLQEKFKVLKNNKTENNILGVAKTIFALDKEEVMILELGTNHPGEIATLAQMSLPDVGVITFVKPVHLEGFGSLRAIYREKASLLKNNRKITAVLNGDDEFLRKVNFCKKVLWFGGDRKNNVYGRLDGNDTKESVFTIGDKYRLRLATPFAGFIYNALAAMAAAGIKKIPLKALAARLSRFSGFPKSRMEVKRVGGFNVIDDSYNSNPYAFCETLKTAELFPCKKIAVVGDMRELGSQSVYYHKSLAGPIIRSKFDYCFTIGNYTKYLNKELNRRGGIKALHFLSHKDIAGFIKKETRHGGEKPDNYLIFLKGSRKMELEKVIEELKSGKP